MRKFIIYTRPIPDHPKAGEAPAVVEVEGEAITGMEDPSVLWLPNGEFKFRITKPEWLYEQQEVKQPDGTKKKVMVPPVWHSHALYSNWVKAVGAAEVIVRQQFEFTKRKTGKDFIEEDVKEKQRSIQKVLL